MAGGGHLGRFRALSCAALPLPGLVRKKTVSSSGGHLAENTENDPEVVAPRGSRRVRRALSIFLLVLLAILAALWFSRERIADNVIGSQLRELDLPATYRIERIGGQRQVLADIRIGDPARPDLTIERAEVDIAYTLGWPKIAGIKIVKPRLYGEIRNGKLSFGSLDKVLFAPSAEPARLPDVRLELVDGRAQLLTEYGPVGIKSDGKGNLRSGFEGVLAATAPNLQTASCTASGLTAFGTVTTADQSPRFEGPVRLAKLRCDDAGVALDSAAAQVDLTVAPNLKDLGGGASLRSRNFAAGTSRARSLAIDARGTWKDGALAGKLAGDIGGVESGGVAMAFLGIDGQVRARDGFGKIEFQGTLDGNGIAPGPGLDKAMAAAEQSTAGTLLAPMLAQVRSALRRERPGSNFAAEVTYRRTGQLWSLIVPSASLRGGSGAQLLSLSRFQLAGGRANSAPLLAGNFSTGGLGLPRIAGRMERGIRGESLFRLTMAPYSAGGGSLALPEMTLAQAPDGSLGFVGEARLTGALPGGSARNLVLPVDGFWSASGALAVFRGCVTPRFDQLALGGLVVERRAVTLCPRAGHAIVEQRGGALSIAAGATALDLAGTFSGTAIRIRSGPVGFAWPGAISAKALDIELGPEGTATRFRLADLSATVGKDVAGRFAGADVQLFSVPLDIVGAGGEWRYAGQRLSISDASLTVLDRADPDRLAPLVASGGTLSLFDNQVLADATLRHAATGREVVRVGIQHNLGNGAGHADLAVDGLTFDKGFQPDDLTDLAKGVVALADGAVSGRGEIDWTAAGVISRGTFSTDRLDFAAAFGPVKGLSGKVEFVDLLGLVTAPRQRVRVASINPGIEVNDGEVEFEIRPNSLLSVKQGKWPFLGGTLTLLPVDLNLGLAETRRYVLQIEGLDAAKFVEKMDLENISATGVFDGQLPLVFDANGGRIEGGLLVSRPPGGNVSYVGQLTYEDLSAMANFAFDALKSLDYTHMTIGMDGSLEGEIVTRVRFDGVKQGAGAKRNILTRAVADLPIQFNVNIRAPFYSLITSVKAMYDPAFIVDPRELGLVDAEGRPVSGTGNGVRAPGLPVIVVPQPPESGSVQPPASGTMR